MKKILNIFEALSFLEIEIKTINEAEEVSLENALGRILCEDIYAKKNLPSFDNSALDGYAFNFEDRKEKLKIKGVILAGAKDDKAIEKNECYKIMTGAKMPLGADTILPLEDESLEDGALIIKESPAQFNALRFKGEDLKEGSKIQELCFGIKLNSRHIGLLASQGIYKIKVKRKIKIALFSNGNELQEPWEDSDKNSIYNANAFAIMGLIKEFFGCEKNYELSYLGIAKDDENEVKKIIENANYDLLISSAGASVGEADFMEKILFSLGFSALFNGLKAKPAKPTKIFKNKDEKIILVLPGNPMSAFLASFIFAKKIISLLNNEIVHFETKKEILLSRPYIKARAGASIRIKNGRNNFILGDLKNYKFIPINNFNSGMIMPLVKSNFVFISEENEGAIKEGQDIKILKL